jgi:hypothetical protein
MVAVADHEPPPTFVLLVSQLGYIGIHFGFERGGKHPPGAFPDDLVDERGTIGSGAVGVHYAEHGRAFPTGAANTGLLDDHQSITREGTPFTFNPRSIHRHPSLVRSQVVAGARAGNALVGSDFWRVARQ